MPRKSKTPKPTNPFEVSVAKFPIFAREIIEIKPVSGYDAVMECSVFGVRETVLVPKALNLKKGEKVVHFPVGLCLPKSYQHLIGLPIHRQHKYEKGIVPLRIGASPKSPKSHGFIVPIKKALPSTHVQNLELNSAINVGHLVAQFVDAKVSMDLTANSADFI